MKTLSRILMLAALATAFALPAFAQDPAASPVALCDEPAKGELYTTYYNLKKTDQPKAYETAKQYLDKYGSCADNYTASVKKFATLYDSAQRRIDFFNAYDKGDVAKVNSLGAQILSADPNDAAVALLSAWGSYQKGFAVKTPTVSADEVAAAAQRAIALLESGKEPLNLEGKTNWLGFSSKDEALAYLNLAIAGAELKTNSDDAVKRLVQIAQGNTKAKEEASVYSFLKFAYDKERELMVARYKTVTKDFTVETPESQLLLANINQVIDRLIDVDAREVAYTTDAAKKAEYMKDLTELYKSRHDGKPDGLNELIAGIKAQPLLITQPVTSLPATPAGDGAAAAAPATGQTTPAGTPVAAPAVSTAKPATTNTTTPKPTTTTSNPPAKKRP